MTFLKNIGSAMRGHLYELAFVASLIIAIAIAAGFLTAETVERVIALTLAIYVSIVSLVARANLTPDSRRNRNG